MRIGTVLVVLRVGFVMSLIAGLLISAVGLLWAGTMELVQWAR